MRINAAAGSSIGNRYQANFDVFHLSTDPLLAVVADGMGDGPGSTMAGRTAVDLAITSPDLTSAVSSAHARVSAYGTEIGALAGCTLTALVERPDGFWVAQIGDSRLYRLRAGLLELLTVDHTMAWLGVLHGWFPLDSPEAARARYHLTRYIGHPAQPAPDLMKITPLPGDVYLLCTDGVAEQVPYGRMAEILGGSAPDAMVSSLLAAADSAGGHDNATAVVVTFA